MLPEGTPQPPRRRVSLLSLFAAALAGGLGAFGVPAAGAHAIPPARSAQAPAPAGAPDAPPELTRHGPRRVGYDCPARPLSSAGRALPW